jgi:hypothetical protein
MLCIRYRGDDKEPGYIRERPKPVKSVMMPGKAFYSPVLMLLLLFLASPHLRAMDLPGLAGGSSVKTAAIQKPSLGDLSPLGGGGRWRVLYNPGTGLPGALNGAVSRPFAGSAREVSRTFLQEAAGLLGVRSVVEELSVVREVSLLGKNVVRYQQVFNGAGVVGALVVVQSDPGGRVVGVASFYNPDISPVNRVVIDSRSAADAAMVDIEAEFGRDAALGHPRVSLLLLPGDGGYTYAWEVLLSTGVPMTHQQTLVDAQTGRIIRRQDLNQSLTVGTGRVYETDRDTRNDQTSIVQLPNLLTPGEGNTGYNLWGAYADVYHFPKPHKSVSSTDWKFRYSPVTNQDKFDQVMGYYHIDGAAGWFSDRFGFDAHVTSPIVLVNVPASAMPGGVCNAFYTSNIDGFHNPGFAFGDEGLGNWWDCGTDLVRSPDVIYHEYTHGAVDWAGLPLSSGLLNHYSRTVNEAVADFFASARFNNPSLGDAWLPPRGLRNLKNRMRYPQDMDYPAYGFPEEHHSSGILGGFLWEARKAMKDKAAPHPFLAADTLIYDALFSWLGDFVPSRYLGEMDFFDFLTAMSLADPDPQWSNFVKVYGFAASRGIISNSPYSNLSSWTDQDVWFRIHFRNSQPRTRTFKARMLRKGDRNDFYVASTEASTPTQRLQINVTRRGGGKFKPKFKVFNEGTGALVAVGDSISAKEARGTIICDTDTSPLGDPQKTYRIAVRGRDNTKGKYKVTVTNLDDPSP